MKDILKEKLFFYLHNFYAIDYLFFIGIFILFIIVIAVVLLNRETSIRALMSLFFSIIMLIFIGVVGYKVLDEKIRPRKVQIIANQKMAFSQNAVVMINISPTYKICKINLKLVKKGGGYIEQIKHQLHPIYQTTFIEKQPSQITKIIPNIKIKDYKLFVNTTCF